MTVGLKVSDKDALSGVDDIYGIYNGTSGPVSFETLGTALAGSGPVADAITGKADSADLTAATTRIDALEVLGATGAQYTAGGPVQAAATANVALTGAYTVDGETLTNGQRYLAPEQTDPAENGIYTYNSAGAHSRATDMDAAGEVSGTLVYVNAGTANGLKTFVTYSEVTTLGTDDIEWREADDASAFSSALAAKADADDGAHTGTSTFEEIDATTGDFDTLTVGGVAVATAVEAGVVETAYANSGGEGDRTDPDGGGYVQVSHSSGITFLSAALGDVQTLVDGSLDNANSIRMADSIDLEDEWLMFDFGATSRKVIQEVSWIVGNDNTVGTAQWQGLTDAGTWESVGDPVTVGGGTQDPPGSNVTTTHDLSDNTTGYPVYRLLFQTATSNVDYIREIEFKIGADTAAEAVAAQNVAVASSLTEAGVVSSTTQGQLAIENAQLRGSIGSIRRGMMDYYCDSEDGDDSNSGTFLGGAKATLDGVTDLTPADGHSVGFAYGSHWRGMYYTGASTSGVAIGLAAGVPTAKSTALPKLDGAIVIDSGDWTASTHEDAAGVVYEYDAARAVEFGEQNGTDEAFYLMWEDGEWLRRVASVAAVAATAGTYFADPAYGTTSTIYVHPFDSTDATSDGKLYEVGHYGAALASYGGSQATRWEQTFEGLHLTRGMGHYGPLSAGMRTTVRGCLLGRGGLHNAVIGSGEVEDSIIVDWDPDNTNAIPLVFYAADPSGEPAVLRRSHFGHPGTPASVNAFYAHSSSGNPVHATSVCEWSVAWPGQFTSVAAVSRTIGDLVSIGAGRALQIAGAGTVASIERVFARFADGMSIGIYNVDGISIPLVKNCGLVLDGGVGAGAMIGTGVDALHNCVLYSGPDSGTGGPLSNDTGDVQDCILMRDAAIGASQIYTLTGTADYNVYFADSSLTLIWRDTVGGTNYTTLSAWRAASGNDLNSVVLDEDQMNNLLLNGMAGLSDGDFRFNPDCRYRFADGTLLIDRVGIREYSDFNTYTVQQGQPSKWPKPPQTEAEGLTYLANPGLWDFYSY